MSDPTPEPLSAETLERYAELAGGDGDAGLLVVGREAMRALLAEVARLRGENADQQSSFDLRWKADMRAIARWRKAKPGRDLKQPDHADLVVWLVEQNDRLHADRRRLCDAAKIALAAFGGEAIGEALTEAEAVRFDAILHLTAALEPKDNTP